jgi:hypothetical protein
VVTAINRGFPCDAGFSALLTADDADFSDSVSCDPRFRISSRVGAFEPNHGITEWRETHRENRATKYEPHNPHEKNQKKIRVIRVIRG